MGTDVALTFSEETTLAELEAIVQRNRWAFVQTGNALAEIRFRRLYRATHATFESYCAERWGFKRQTAYDYLKAAEVVENVRAAVQRLPSLTQAVEMAVLEPEQQREVAAAVDFGATPVRKLKERIDKVRNPTANSVRNHRAQGAGQNECTPAEYVEAARDVMGSIELAIANETGLSQEWSAETLWMNPPQPLTSQFIEKLLDALATGHVWEATALTNSSADAAWFHRAGEACQAICFVSPEGEKGSPLQGQAFFYFGPNVRKFAERFRAIGLVLVPYKAHA
jgi:hypothetical protein